VSDQDAGLGPQAAGPAVSAEPQARITFSVPRWLRQFGYASWLLIGIVIVLVGLSTALSAGRTIVVPTLFAILLGATFLPVVDRMERWHIKRWISALVVTLLIVAAGLGLTYIVVKGLIDQAPTIGHQTNAGVDAIQKWLTRYHVSADTTQSVRDSVKKAGSSLAQGAAGGVLKGVQSVAALIFGIFIALNILVYLLISGRSIGHWASTVAKPVPQPVAYAIIANSARFMRGYIWGSTIIGVFNGLVVAVGALIIGVPLAATMGIVAWATNYIPMFGALIGGAFAVLIALGVGGIDKALLMLIVVLIANGPLQNVVSQFALGSALHLNGLVVLFATTIGGIAAGAIGGVFAAPFTKIALDAYSRLRAAGMFDEDVKPSETVIVEIGPPGTGPPGAPPDAAS
jgi:putative heme transporter